MYLQTAPHVDYLVDQASVQEVSLPGNWKTQADTDIDRIRKANINIQLVFAWQVPHHVLQSGTTNDAPKRSLCPEMNSMRKIRLVTSEN